MNLLSDHDAAVTIYLLQNYTLDSKVSFIKLRHYSYLFLDNDVIWKEVNDNWLDDGGKDGS